jgi:hypothetical protein
VERTGVVGRDDGNRPEPELAAWKPVTSDGSLRAMRMPRPPPPAAALIMIG